MIRGIQKFYFKDILQIAIPIVFGNLAFMLIAVGDVIVAGRHSTQTLAAISLATAITSCIMMLGIGILVSTSAILSNYRGEGKQAEKYFYPAVKSAFFLSILISIIIWGFIPLIDYFGFEQTLNPMIKEYFFITGFAVFGGFLHCTAKEYLQAFGIVLFPNILSILCVFLNVFLNIIFVFGYGAIPSMGVTGLALASLITRYVMGFTLFFYCFKKIKIKYHRDKNYYKDLIKVGLPASMAIMIEFVAFNAITMILGRISGIYAAAQNVICTLTSVSFMIPLAISNATSVKIGYCNGATMYKSLIRYSFAGILMSVGVMSVSAIIIASCPEFLTSLFTADKELIKICVPVVYLLCFFQVFDGLQVALSGIFRGIKKTRVVMFSNFISYWIISLPLGSLLALYFKLNLIGFWYSLLISSVVLCSIMFGFLIRFLKKVEAENKSTPTHI